MVRYRPEKGGLYRTQLTVGGSLIIYPSDYGTPTVDLLTVNLLIIGVISTPDAKFMTIDIKNFYLNTLMKQFEYMKLKINDLPKDFIKEYDLAPKFDQNEYVYIEIRCRWTFFDVWFCSYPIKKWRFHHYLPSHQGCHVLRRRIRSRIPIHRLPRINPSTTSVGNNGT